MMTTLELTAAIRGNGRTTAEVAEMIDAYLAERLEATITKIVAALRRDELDARIGGDE